MYFTNLDYYDSYSCDNYTVKIKNKDMLDGLTKTFEIINSTLTYIEPKVILDLLEEMIKLICYL